MEEWDEKACIEAAKEDPRAFDKIYQHYVDRIYAYLYRRVGNVRDAEDLTSRTFYRALSHLPDYEDRGFPFSAWLYRIAHNLMANWHRDNSRKSIVSLDAAVLRNVVEPQPESVAELEYDVRLLRDVIRTLDPARQELLVLKFTEGLMNREIGTIMGRSEGAIKSLYHRTLVELREKMAEKGLGVE